MARPFLGVYQQSLRATDESIALVRVEGNATVILDVGEALKRATRPHVAGSAVRNDKPESVPTMLLRTGVNSGEWLGSAISTPVVQIFGSVALERQEKLARYEEAL